MSSDTDQPTLATFDAVVSQGGPDVSGQETSSLAPNRARYGRDSRPDIQHGDQPAADPEKPVDQCQNCGAKVSSRERRLFGDNGGVLWHCHSCTEREAIRGGAGSVPELNDEHDQ